MSDFSIELQAIAKHCDFGNFLDTALRDRFVAGVRKVRTGKVLLALGSKAKFSEVVETAKREELLYEEAGKMEVAEATSLNRLQAAQGKQAQEVKTRERSMRFVSEKEKNSKCFKCKKIGHFARNCRVEKPIRGFSLTER